MKHEQQISRLEKNSIFFGNNNFSRLNIYKKSEKKCKCQNFTLTELLVVIAIITIIAGMLLPALNKARETGKQIKCLSNHKQLMASMLSYTGDYSDYYVPYGRINSGAMEAWTSILIKNNYATASGVFFCPASPASNALLENVWKVHVQTISVAWLGFLYPDIGYNGYWIGSSGRPLQSAALNTAPAKNTQIKNPSRTIVLADTKYTDDDIRGYYLLVDMYMEQDTGASIGVLKTRHNGKNINVAWADGHASTQTVVNRFNPYMSDPFKYGPYTEHIDKCWDRK